MQHNQSLQNENRVKSATLNRINCRAVNWIALQYTGVTNKTHCRDLSYKPVCYFTRGLDNQNILKTCQLHLREGKCFPCHPFNYLSRLENWQKFPVWKVIDLHDYSLVFFPVRSPHHWKSFSCGHRPYYCTV